MPVSEDDESRSLYALFDRAAEFAGVFPFDSVFTYVAKRLLDDSLSITSWAIAEPLLLRAVLSEPSMLPVLAELYKLHGVIDQEGLAATLEAICLYHAPLQQGYEIAWAVWIACITGTVLSSEVAAKIIEVDDDIVALVALDARNRGLLPFWSSPLWEGRMSESSLYSSHWLLAYEALAQQWLPSVSGIDYVLNDSFFSILRAHNVKFYDASGLAGQVMSHNDY